MLVVASVVSNSQLQATLSPKNYTPVQLNCKCDYIL